MSPIITEKETREFIRKSFKKGGLACLTGAGISAESGIPTFRGEGGLWEKYDPAIYANTQGLISILRNNPEGLVNFIVDFYSTLLPARPNLAHITLANLQKQAILSGMITQNIDNLHQDAGSRSVIELHGNAFRIRCMGCAGAITLERARLKEMVELLKINRRSRFKILKILSRYFPHCNCGSRYRIDIVLFGEMLPEEALSRAYEEMARCKTLLIIGSSLEIYPAAGLPLYAKERGAKLIEINSQASSLSGICDCKITGSASVVLPEIQQILKN